jgi:hypothetical protein
MVAAEQQMGAGGEDNLASAPQRSQRSKMVSPVPHVKIAVIAGTSRPMVGSTSPSDRQLAPPPRRSCCPWHRPGALPRSWDGVCSTPLTLEQLSRIHVSRSIWWEILGATAVGRRGEARRRGSRAAGRSMPSFKAPSVEADRRLVKSRRRSACRFWDGARRRASSAAQFPDGNRTHSRRPAPRPEAIGCPRVNP